MLPLLCGGDYAARLGASLDYARTRQNSPAVSLVESGFEVWSPSQRLRRRATLHSDLCHLTTLSRVIRLSREMTKVA
jgi:hypothetical protein